MSTAAMPVDAAALSFDAAMSYDTATPFDAGMSFDTAEIQRDLPAPDTGVQTAEEASHQHAQAGGVEPDLDALARQVYTVLRRRLDTERRRFS